MRTRGFYRKAIFASTLGHILEDSTLPIALATGTAGCVLALEPNPFVYHVLEKNARANSHAVNIRTMMAAANFREGFIDFEYSDSGFCNGGRHEGIPAMKHGHPFRLEVFCVNLEQELRGHYSELLPRLKFIKVDAEGYDLYVLESILGIIKSYKPIVKAEVFKHTDLAYREKLLSFFLKLDYQVYKIVEEPIGKGPLLTEENLTHLQHYDILCLPDRLI